jgi:LmbE family N-acetylglucosaminyl deacetylase
VVLDLTLAVVSPHLDDAVLSLGAAIAARPEPVRVVTVLAGDPLATAPAGPWDARCGFRTQGEATAARRHEDRRACALVGAEPRWLAFGDDQYGRGGDDDAILRLVLEAIGDADTVLLPGHPLAHGDHRWVAGLLARAVAGGELRGRRIGSFLEQPYALKAPSGAIAAVRVAPGTPEGLRLEAVPAPRQARRVKRRAVLAYRSQLGLLGEANGTNARGLVRAIARLERARGGEQVAWWPA